MNQQVAETAKTKQWNIIINGREKIVFDHKVTYSQIVSLYLSGAPQDPNTIYTVTYRRGNSNQEGSMVDGDTVTIKDGMVFNVSATTKS